MSGPTQGPWNICWRTFDGERIGFHITGVPYGSTRRVCDASDTDAPEMVANAHLIAASPEMRDFMYYQADIIDRLIERLREAELVDDMDIIEFNKWSQSFQQIVEKAEVKP